MTARTYKYVYDLWNSLRRVNKTSNSALVAEYRYYGLEHRIADVRLPEMHETLG